jgi:hypothetical protein
MTAPIKSIRRPSMLCQHKMALPLFFLAAALPSTTAAATVYNEAVNGDLSNSGLSPTPVTVTGGSNQIFGATGSGPNGVDLDYFTISVPTGWELSAITVLPGTISGGNVSFFGVEAGDQVTLSPSTFSAAGLLGWWHYGPGDIGSDILPDMGIPADGSIGFSGSLGSGDYSSWIQELSPGSFNYGFDLTLTAAPVPEPGTYGLALIGFGVTALLVWRRNFATRIH